MFPSSKFNAFPFFAVLLALLLCLPLLETTTTAAKRVPQKKPVVQDEEDAPFYKAGLVNLKKMGTGFAYDIRYATTNNFTHQKLYRQPRSFLRAETAGKLAAANRQLMSMGYRIKIFDAYRPFSVQKILFSKVPSGKKLFIANPYTHGSNHNRGTAVDITLVRLDGSPVDMPTDFDTFNDRAEIYTTECSEKQAENRELLASVMVKNGFVRLPCEWWHYDDSDTGKYGIIDIMF